MSAARWGLVILVVCGAAVAVSFSRNTAPDTIRAAVAADRAEAGPTSDGTGAAASAPAAPPVLDPGPAPPVAPTDGWLSSAGLTSTDLAGRVVLYDFWTFGCVNCQHTLPSVKAWHERYAGDGLVVLSIHTPEFDYEADPANVARFVADNGIAYPVALDPGRDIWRAWDNHYWPAFYLYDGEGRLRLRHFGEGSYDETEDAIRSLLGVDPASPRATGA